MQVLSVFKVVLKLVRTNLNYQVLRTSTAAICFNDHSLDKTYIPPMNVMLDFISMRPGARRKRQNTK